MNEESLTYKKSIQSPPQKSEIPGIVLNGVNVCICAHVETVSVPIIPDSTLQ